jgi:CO/xanthine dehydrogenase Mo-binding subunit
MGIGSDIDRVDGVSKLIGSAAYVDDLAVPGVWHGGVVRSSIARGRVTGIQFAPEINWDEFAVVTHKDIPGQNVVKLIDDDQPILAAGNVMHKHEPIVLLAHPSPGKLRRALRAVSIEYETQAAVLSPLDPLSDDMIQFGNDNVFKTIDIVKGDTSRCFDRAAHVVEGHYRTGSQEHVYLETQGMLAVEEPSLTTIKGSMQCPYYVVEALAEALNRTRDEIRVVSTPVGGGFGGKEEYPSVLAIHAALLAREAGAPVKIIYDRQEDMAVTTKRHPAYVHHRTALDRDGRLLAMEINVVLDGGAYVTLSPVVLSRGAIHASGPYRCEHIHVHGEVRLTNSPPYGAFRGFGAPQTIFAMERHMDVIARTLGMDAVQLRRRNLLQDGDTMTTGQVFQEGIDLVRLMDHALSQADFEKSTEVNKTRNEQHPYLKRGVGVATFHHGAGFTGAGEVHLESEVWARGLPDGRIEVLTAQTDMGQGTSTILAQIASEATGLAEHQITVATPDTSRVPNSGPTVASRTAMVVGDLVSRACRDLAKKAGGPALTGAALQQAIVDWYRKNEDEELLGRARYRKPEFIEWDEVNYRGDAYACYAWATHVAHVEIDLRTWSARVVDYLAHQDVGKVLNPTLAQGQIQGGVAQGIGWALTEDVILEDGAMQNAQMTNYIIPGSGDLPPIRVSFEETPSSSGPAGAKGMGELPMDGPAPAIVNAICDALGVNVTEIPVTPEKLMQIMERARS